MLFTGSIKDIDKSKYDEIWIIARKIGNVQTGGNIYHVPQLAPSYDLLNRYLSWRSQGIWNKDQFDTVYIPQFLNEMQMPMAQQYLRLLQSKSKEKDVLICCFCSDESMCHRTLVKGIIESMNNTFYLLIAGSRSFNNYPLLKEKLDYLLQNQRDKEIHIVSGGAKGADTLAKWYAKERGYQMHVFPADWSIGKSAGYRRNETMHKFIAQFEHRGCVCFWDGESKGTAHNFKLCEIFNTPLRIVRFYQ
jgi:uncharacterized protein YeaO (DUF488 family)